MHVFFRIQRISNELKTKLYNKKCQSTKNKAEAEADQKALLEIQILIMTNHDTLRDKNNENLTIQNSLRKNIIHHHLHHHLHQNQKVNKVSDKKEMKVFHINQIIKLKKQRL